METRLSEIQDGKATAIIRAANSAHREKQTLCIGVQWNLVSSEDLVDIVTVSRSSRMSSIITDERFESVSEGRLFL